MYEISYRIRKSAVSSSLFLTDQLNARAIELLESVRPDASVLGIEISSLSCGAEIFDFGSSRTGTFEAGELLAEICMGDLAHVSLTSSGDPDFPMSIGVATDYPLQSCMAAQYAGWPLRVADYFSMCSGPARCSRGKEEVLDEYNLVTPAEEVVAVLESSDLPDNTVAEVVSAECNVAPDRVKFCIARTSSLPGTIQVVARSVETAMHKLHELKFDLSAIKNAFGTAPLPPIAKDDLTALGWTNDAVLYGAVVQLVVDCEDNALESIGEQVPSCSSSDFGTPFLDIFQRFDHDFYKIDKMLFSPSKVIFNNVQSGHVFAFGETRKDILLKSWGLDTSS